MGRTHVFFGEQNMETDIDRVRRIVGFSLFAMVAVSLVVGAVLLGRIVGDAIGSAYVGIGPAATDGLPMPPMPLPPAQAAPEVGSLAPERPGMPPVRRSAPRPNPVVKQSK
jgi:hypothetical protein